MDSYAKDLVNKIQLLDETSSRLNQKCRDIREKKKFYSEELYKWMVKNDISEYESIKIKKVCPKPKIKKKKNQDKKKDAIKYFGSIGISDPETVWIEFQQTQKYDELPDNK